VSPTGIGDQRHLAALTRLEADRGAGGHVEAMAAGLVAIEDECRIGFGEMVVGADLDGAVAGIGDIDGDPLAPLAERDLAVL